MKASKEPWEYTKEYYCNIPIIKAASKDKLLNPSFKYVFEIIKYLIAHTGFAQKLYSPEELSYSNYKSIENIEAFMLRLLNYMEAAGKRSLGLSPQELVGISANPEKLHYLLKVAHQLSTKRLDTEAVKRVRKNNIFPQKEEKKDPGRNHEDIDNPESYVHPEKNKEVLKPKSPTQSFAKEERIYFQLREETILEIEKLNLEMHNLKRQLAQDEKIIEELNTEKEQLTANIEKKQLDLKILQKYKKTKDIMSNQEEEILQMKMQSANCTREIEEKNEKILQIRDKIRYKEEEIAAIERESKEHIRELKEECEELSSKIQEENSALGSMKMNTVNHKRALLKAEDDKISNQIRQNEALQRNIEAVDKNKIENRRDTLDELESKKALLKRLQDEEESLQYELDSLKENNTQLSDKSEAKGGIEHKSEPIEAEGIGESIYLSSSQIPQKIRGAQTRAQSKMKFHNFNNLFFGKINV